jgi:phage/plasmid-associated DNA primase
MQVTGEWNVLVTANTRLKVKVQGDRGAWARRILILDFSQPKPEKTTPNYHDVLIDTEGPGILSWFIQGAEEIISISKEAKPFPVSQRQKETIDNLMNESDSVRYFITNHIRGSSMAADCITSEELYNAYLQLCSNRNWSCEPERSFHVRAADLMTEIHRTAQRSNHIRRNDDDQGVRGYRNVTIIPYESLDEAF